MRQDERNGECISVELTRREVSSIRYAIRVVRIMPSMLALLGNMSTVQDVREHIEVLAEVSLKLGKE